MNKTHATVIALLLGLAAVFGLFAALRTTHLGASARTAASASIAAQQRQLTAAEQALTRTPAQKPAAAHAARVPRTVYVRPAPIIVHLHRHGDDGEGGDNGD